MLVIPELFSMGYLLPQTSRSGWQKMEGTTLNELSQQAKNTGITVLYGYPEVVQSVNSKLYTTLHSL